MSLFQTDLSNLKRLAIILLTAATTLLLLPQTTASAQNGENPSPPVPTPSHQDIRFEHLTRDDGLSHMRVYTIVQDQSGFLWFGTQDGLNHYDGYNFVVYKPDDENPNSLSDRYVRALLVDKEGDIWIGTQLGGVNRFDPVTQTFSQYRHDPDNPQSLIPGWVFGLFEDSSGTIWVGTDQGFSSIDPTSGEIISYINKPEDPNTISYNGGNAIHEDNDGMLWFGTDGGGLDRFNRDTGEFTHYKHNPEDPDSLCDDSVIAITEDTSGLLWLGTQGGMNAFDPETGSLAYYKHNPDDPGSLSNDTVTTIHEDSQGVLWVGTSGGGLNQLDRSTGEFIRYQHDPSNPLSLTNNNIIDIFEDEGGILWVGTHGGGLDKFDRSQQRFVHIRHEPDNSNSLDNNIVSSVFEGKDAVIWIGTVKGLNRFDRSSGTYTHFQNDPNDPITINVGETIRTIFEDHESVLWVGTTGEGLNRYDPAEEVFQHYRHDPDDANSISHDTVISIYEDPEGELWMGTNSGGLNKYDRQTESFQVYGHNPEDPNGNAVDWINIIHEDQSGLMWLGTPFDGLNWFDREKEQFGFIRHDPDDPNSLSSDQIRAIYQDTSGILWVGTPLGLNKIIFHSSDLPRDMTIERYTEQDGLPSNVIEGILEDDKGNLWISSTGGISRLDPRTGSFKNFTAAQGLSSDEFTRAVAVKLSSGEMLFGGSAGLTLFAPDEITDNPYIPPIKLTDFKLLNKPVALGGDSPLQQSIWETDQLTLSHLDDVLTFEFAALSFANPLGNQYQYMLEGFDHEWSPVSHKRSATYTNLNPGKYVFRVRGSNNDGVWNEEGTSIAITITPRWWGTTWFRVLALLLLVGLVFGAYRWRLSSLETRSQELEKMVAEKTHQLDERVKEMNTLLSVSQEITSTLDLEPLLSQILDELKKVVEYDVATIRRLTQGKMELKAHRWLFQQAGQPSQHLSVAQIPIIGDMIQTREVILVGDHQFAKDIVGDMDLYEVELTGEVLKASRSLMVVPLIVKDEVIGMMVLGHHKADYWRDETKELVQAFANQVAVAITNTELYVKAGEAATLEERARLARELHDSATQSLYSATLFSEAGKELADQGDLESASYYLMRVSEVVFQAFKDMRLLVFELRPPEVAKEGLVVVIQKRLDSVEKRAGVETRLTGDPMITLSDEANAELYAITLEALNNVLKHADPDSVAVNIRSDGEVVTLEVVDDGSGFEIGSEREGGGMGLGTMQERAERLGGELTIESTLGQGTSVKVNVPVTQDPAGTPEYKENS